MPKNRGFEDAGFPRDFILPGHPALSAKNDPDAAIRSAAFSRIRQLIELYGGAIPASEIAAGFAWGGETIYLATRARGIFKPQQMQTLLSIKTVLPRAGRRVWYDDQRDVHRDVYEGVETVDYAFMGTDPEARDNRLLREAMQMQLPIIYFLGIAPGLYEAILPTFIVGWDALALKAKISFGVSQQIDEVPPETQAQRRYALRTVKQRLHQDTFRAAVLQAYNRRCALSNLPEPLLLDAAHIIADAEEDLGQPIVPNGLPLTKIHHAAFDKHLIGIDDDYRIHLADRLKRMKDGPLLEVIKELEGRTIRLPDRTQDYPDPARLARRFKEFKAAS